MSVVLCALALLTMGVASPNLQVSPTVDYVIYAEGKRITFSEMAEQLREADAIFAGELHDHTQGHALQAEILRALAAQDRKVALGMEMFERDAQSVLEEYLAGYITEASFLQASRPWPNYKADYRPMVEFCKEKGLRVVGTNAPRRYVNVVSRKGQAALLELPKSAKAFLPRLPYPMDLPEGYQQALNGIFGGAHGEGTTPSPNMPSPERMKEAQGLWDESMKDGILKFLRGNRGGGWRVLHLNGAMHSDYGYGIVARLRKSAPRLKVRVISVKPAEDYLEPNWKEYAGMGDFVILTKPVPPKEEKK